MLVTFQIYQLICYSIMIAYLKKLIFIHCFLVILKDASTLRESNIKNGTKVMLIGSSQQEIQNLKESESKSSIKHESKYAINVTIRNTAFFFSFSSLINLFINKYIFVCNDFLLPLAV